MLLNILFDLFKYPLSLFNISVNYKIIFSDENLLFNQKIKIFLIVSLRLVMDKFSSKKSKSLNINPKNNRFILKLFGDMNHDHITIEKDEILTISKIHIDNFEKKGQISKWKFNLDRIYTKDTTFDELYENEIENNDYLQEFNKQSQYRTLSFIGDRNDSLTEEPYKSFIIRCIKECLNDIKLTKSKINEDTLIPIISFCELNKSFIIDYFKKNDITDINNNNSTNNNVILNPKLNIYDDDVIIKDLSQIQISNENDVISLLNLAKKNAEYFKLNKWNNSESKKESLCQIITLKLLKSSTNECYSKINYVLYKAYEILDEEEIKPGKNTIYNLYTKDNYNFFHCVQNKINYRLSYAIQYLRDTLVKGNNLFIIILPCEYQYLLLIYDLLDNINMRQLIVENILLSEEDDESTNQFGEIYRFENISELSINDKDMNDDNLFQSFSKNNSVITNVSSILDIKPKNFLGHSYFDNKLTEGKNKRKDINYERLRKIDNKTNIIHLFGIFDKLSIEDF